MKPINASPKFHADFAYLAIHFGWEGDEYDEMRNWVRQYPKQNVPYVQNLADQWRHAEGLPC